MDEQRLVAGVTLFTLWSPLKGPRENGLKIRMESWATLSLVQVSLYIQCSSIKR